MVPGRLRTHSPTISPLSWRETDWPPRMLESTCAAFDVVARQQSEPRGLVRLSCPLTVAHGALGALLPVFLARFPKVRVQMLVTNRPVDPVDDGVDLALRVRPVIENSATLVAKTFGTSRTMLVAQPALLMRQGPVHSTADLSRLDTVAMAVGDGRSSWRLVGPDGQVIVHTHEPRYVADDLLSLLRAAVAGTGAALMPGYLCRADLADNLAGDGPREAAGLTYASAIEATSPIRVQMPNGPA